MDVRPQVGGQPLVLSKIFVELFSRLQEETFEDCDSISLDVSLKTVILPQKYMSAIEKILKGLRSHEITQ